MKVFNYLMNYQRLSLGVVIVTALLGAYWLSGSGAKDLADPALVAEVIPATQFESAATESQSVTELIIPMKSKPTDSSVISDSTDESAQSADNLAPEAQVSLFAGLELKELFKDAVLNEHTAYIAELLRMEFDASFDQPDRHFRQVEKFLNEALDDPQKVAELISFYRNFTEFQTSQAQDPQPLWMENPETIEDAIRLNNEKQQYRSTFFGQEVADQVWGHEQKEAEYQMKVQQILRNDDYGAGTEIKEQLIAKLQAETWGEEEQSVELEQRTRFYAKLADAGEELLKMTDEEREAKINEFRAEIFPSAEAQSMTQEDKKADTGS